MTVTTSERTDCPWRGPRPYGAEEHELFFGRADDIRLILDLVYNTRLSVLVAPSGVGKTSLLQAGLLPTMRASDAFPDVTLVVRSWPMGIARDADAFLAEAVRLALGKEDPEQEWVRRASLAFASHAGMAAAMAELAEKERVFLVFDQFEEILKSDRALGADVLDILAQLYYRHHGLHQLISLRQEHLVGLRRLEHQVSPLRSSTMELGPIPEPSIVDVITGPAARCGVTVTTDAVDLLREWWRVADDEGASALDGHDPAAAPVVGLLHLQALLVAAFRWLEASRGTVKLIDADGLEAFMRAAGIEDRRLVVGEALRRWVADQFPSGISPRHLDERRALENVIAARFAPHLSSGGYKIAQDEAQLAWLVLEDEFALLDLDRPQVTAAVRARARGDLSAAADALDIGGAMAGRLSGRARRWTLQAAATELLDAFVAVGQRLVDAELCRVRQMRAGVRTFELVHDGLAQPLVLWANELLASREPVLGSLVALRGDELRLGTMAPDNGPAELAAVCWLGCWVSGDGDEVSLTDLTFRGATLQGTVFRRCTFRRVTFEDCDLTGVIFIGCTFEEVAFRDCRMDGAAFREGVLSTVALEKVSAQGMVLEEATVEGFALLQCATRGMVWIAPRAGSVEIRDSVLNQWHWEIGVTDGPVRVQRSTLLLTSWIEGLSAKMPPGTLVLDSCDVVHCMLPSGVAGVAELSADNHVFPSDTWGAAPPPLAHTPRGVDPWRAVFSSN